MTRRITVRDLKTQEVVETMEFPDHDSLYDRAFSGLLRKVDLERFYVKEDWQNPPMSRNVAIDTLVVLAIKNGKRRLSEITAAVVGSEHKHGIVISDGAVPASRIIDKSLQRLRKSGKIGYSETGWGAFE